MGYCYDIYYDTWDIGYFKYEKGQDLLSYIRIDYFTLPHLQSRMQVEGLQECRYKYGDIIKGKVYPSKFLWEVMDHGEFESQIVDTGIRDIVKQQDEERRNWTLDATRVHEGLKLYLTGEYGFDEIITMTGAKVWKIHKALYRANEAETD